MPSRLIRDCRFAAIDFESAGVERGGTDHPVQIGIVCGALSDQVPNQWESYIAPGRPVLWSASQVHGITTEMLREAPSLMQLWVPIRKLLSGAVVIGHNTSTERRFLRSFPGHGFGPWVDTLALSRQCLKGVAQYSLEAVCKALNIADDLARMVPGKTWHDARFDAAASWLVFKTIVTELKLEGHPLECLGSALTC